MFNDFYCKKIKDLLNLYGIMQNVHTFTRCNNMSSTLVDYVLSNFSIKTEVHDIPKITDHSIILINIREDKPKSTKTIKVFRNLCELNINNINLELINCNFLLNSCNIDVFYNDFANKFRNIIDSVAPVKEYELNSDSVPWYDYEIKCKAKERDLAYQAYNKNNNPTNWENYKVKRNIVVNLLKTKKRAILFSKD
ncbi:hypothetical protein NQ314_005050 [Rhamnusium bicolor]|uniref:Uncharacterized protein n=1 Tax=Rhamnusium bicolor TaxID=1586634 RepID=A0AAV8ZJ30_9CUCU|nr:hypothetical protein NQ314_005050 [Rhamnusium bicolor]